MEKAVESGDQRDYHSKLHAHRKHSFDMLKSSWKQFDKAGSRFLVQLCESLAGSQYDIITKEIVALLGPIFACSESELVLGRMKEIENFLVKEEGEKSQEDLVSSKQKSLKCLLLFIKMQSDYHQLCSNLVTSAIDHLNVTGDSQEHVELLQEIQSLKLHNPASPVPSVAKHAGLRRTSGSSGISSPKINKHGLKASLFSLFERKNSPEEGKSLFYVDFDGKDALDSSPRTVSTGQLTITNQSSVEKARPGSPAASQSSQSDVLIDLGLDPNPSDRNQQDDKLTPSHKVPTSDGHVATQEELDSVINLLSGFGLGRGSMQTIPEVQNPYSLHVLSGSVGTAFSPATSDSLEERERGSLLRNKSQRRSEGSIDLTGFTKGGRNTWPNQHRASLPGGQSGAPPQITYDFASPPVQYTYGAGYQTGTFPSGGVSRPTTLPPGGAGHFQDGYAMGFPDPKLNRTWPVSNLAGSGSVMDTINSSWSGGQDSDDLSDDSSNGEQLQTMSRMQFAQPRRDLFADSDTRYLTGEVKHHSLEDLLDSRSSNTWPHQLQQPWSQSHLGVELVGSHDQGVYHRPVSMQMSDPLSRRNIWQNSGPELAIPPAHSQSLHGGLGPV